MGVCVGVRELDCKEGPPTFLTGIALTQLSGTTTKDGRDSRVQREDPLLIRCTGTTHYSTEIPH